MTTKLSVPCHVKVGMQVGTNVMSSVKEELVLVVPFNNWLHIPVSQANRMNFNKNKSISAEWQLKDYHCGFQSVMGTQWFNGSGSDPQLYYSLAT